jgi:glycine cleavage system H protein
MPRPGPAMRQVHRFPLALDRGYHLGSHMWVKLTGPGRARIGMDPLAVETSGTLAELSLPAAGTQLTVGQPFGQLEAVKFVGPLTSPVSGTVLACNAAAAADPGLVERDPFGDGWLIEAELADTGELGALLSDPEEITAWYAASIEEYRCSGAIAE